MTAAKKVSSPDWIDQLLADCQHPEDPTGAHGLNISKKWTMPIRDWEAALNRFTIQFEDRMPQH